MVTIKVGITTHTLYTSINLNKGNKSYQRRPVANSSNGQPDRGLTRSLPWKSEEKINVATWIRLNLIDPCNGNQYVQSMRTSPIYPASFKIS